MATEQGKIGHPAEGADDTDQCDVEYADRGHAIVSCNSADQKVGGRADQRACATQDRGVGKRDQQLVRRRRQLARQLDHHRDHHLLGHRLVGIHRDHLRSRVGTREQAYRNPVPQKLKVDSGLENQVPDHTVLSKTLKIYKKEESVLRMNKRKRKAVTTIVKQ